MPFNQDHPDYKGLRAKIRENPRQFVVVIGAGLSRPAGYPTWSELLESLKANALDRASDQTEDQREAYEARIKRIGGDRDLWRAFSEIKRELPPHAYNEVIKSSLSHSASHTLPKAYEYLWRLNICGMVNLNLDSCAVHSFAQLHSSAVDTATADQSAKYSSFLFNTDPFVLHPHGVVSDPDSWVLTKEDLDRLLTRQSYLTFMEALLTTKSTVLVGVNTEDFLIQSLLQKHYRELTAAGPKHYAIIADADTALIRDHSRDNIAVISYSPSDRTNHPEILQMLQDFVAFVPQDVNASSVYTGPATDANSLPQENELRTKPVEEIRRLLNGAIKNILPSDKTPSLTDLDNLDKFYSEHLASMHMAWLIDPSNDEYRNLYGYKTVETLGRGAFGQVYKVEKSEGSEVAAVKVLLPEIRQRREYLNSFRRGVNSMRILTRKNLPRMVRILEAYEVPACVFMEYIQGPTLTQAKDWNYLDQLSHCLEVLVQVGEVIHSAHNLEERVLHRDIKPDNVILRNYWSFGDDLDAVVLDFDLSWHKGASDLSVVQGAHAQGYAAPELTATGRQAGISTRHTAVDVFGFGMLAFFLFTGRNPSPNEHRLDNFEMELRKSLQTRFTSDWQSLIVYLSGLVVSCTLDKQSERIAFGSALEGFRTARDSCRSNKIACTHPLFLRELGTRLDVEGRFEVQDFGRRVRVHSKDNAKCIELQLDGKGDRIWVDIVLSRQRAESDPRHIERYLEKAKNKAVSKLNFNPLERVTGSIGRSRIDVSARWYVNKSVSVKLIAEIAERLSEARMEMRFE